MTFMETLRHASLFALLTIAIGIAPMLMGALYAVRPTGRRLVLMRPLSLATIFAAVAGLVSGFAAILRGTAATGEFTPHIYRVILMSAAEALAPVLVGFGCLTIAWLLVALGMRRTVESDGIDAAA